MHEILSKKKKKREKEEEKEKTQEIIVYIFVFLPHFLLNPKRRVPFFPGHPRLFLLHSVVREIYKFMQIQNTELNSK